MNMVTVPSAVAQAWKQLTVQAPVSRSYDSSLADGLPEPARRWLAHPIKVGTPLWASTELEMSGEIKLGKHWQPFRARQVHAPDKGSDNT